ncbi:MAG: tRNA pseudouridine(38-40) synthase TruA [Ktedonobacterales bacterium]
MTPTTFAARIAYDGTRFSGFQRQAVERGPTVQGEIEAALARIAGEPIAITAAGRTDSGVHAMGQVIGFRVAARLTGPDWRRALNALLPTDIAARAVGVAPDDFHARKHALERRYRYRILCDSARDPLRERYVWRVANRLDVAAMAAAAALLVGEHDFAAFGSSPWDRKADGYRAHTVRRLTLARCAWEPSVGAALDGEPDREPDGEDGGKPDEITFDFAANAFLTGMVRRLVGTLALVGAGKLAPADVQAMLAAREKAHPGAAAPPQGLCLARVTYPSGMLAW